MQKSFGVILILIIWCIFNLIVDGLNIKRCEISKEHSDPILKSIKTFEKYPSIPKIKELNSCCRFSFETVRLEDVKNVTRDLDITKASQLLDVPTKIIKQNADIFSEFFFVNINHSINHSISRAVKMGRCKASFQE